MHMHKPRSLETPHLGIPQTVAVTASPTCIPSSNNKHAAIDRPCIATISTAVIITARCWHAGFLSRTSQVTLLRQDIAVRLSDLSECG
jgi:hypothetical protein